MCLGSPGILASLIAPLFLLQPSSLEMTCVGLCSLQQKANLALKVPRAMPPPQGPSLEHPASSKLEPEMPSVTYSTSGTAEAGSQGT